MIVATRPSTAAADLIKLRNGGEIRGIIERKVGATDSERIIIETMTGAVIVVDQRDVEFVARRPLTIEEYETRAKSTPNTVEAQWKLAEWCRNKRLKKQREVHLQRVLKLDPYHEQAHRGLGHVQHDGVWLSRDESMKAQGYVKYKGKYVTKQELELLETNEARTAAERRWYKNVKLWHGWLARRQADRSRRGLNELKKIKTPDAIPALVRYFRDDPNKQVRLIYVDILRQIPGANSLAALVAASLRDVDRTVRSEAFKAISPDQFELATMYYIRRLTDAYNTVVRRAAKALEKLGNEQAVPALINALVTTHQYRVRVPDTSTPSFSFGHNGSFANPSYLPPDIELQLRAGLLPYGVIVNAPGLPRRTRVVTIKHNHKNSQALAALKTLTGQNFGYDERTWGLWWAAQKDGANKVPALP